MTKTKIWRVLRMECETPHGTDIDSVVVGDNYVELRLTGQGALRLAALADDLRAEVNRERVALRNKRRAAGFP